MKSVSLRRLCVALVAGLLVSLTGCPAQPTGTPGSTATLTVDGQPVTVSVPTGTVTVAVAPPTSYPMLAEHFDLGALDIDVSTPTNGAVVQRHGSRPRRRSTRSAN